MATSEMSVPFSSVSYAQCILRCLSFLPGKRPIFAHRRLIRTELIFHHLNGQDLEQRSLQRLLYLRSTLKAQGWRRGVAQHCVGQAVRRLSAVHRRFKDRCSMKIEDLVLDQLNRLHVAATH